MAKLNLLQSSVSHDPSEFFYYADLKHYFSMLKTAVLFNIFVEAAIHDFSILWWEFKRTTFISNIKVFYTDPILLNGSDFW